MAQQQQQPQRQQAVGGYRTSYEVHYTLPVGAFLELDHQLITTSHKVAVNVVSNSIQFDRKQHHCLMDKRLPLVNNWCKYCHSF